MPANPRIMDHQRAGVMGSAMIQRARRKPQIGIR